jgi:O-acetyl-ADP-ribose deacetylase (regulator of RNase III)
MMINLIYNGNIFNSTCEALVNPVNCVGIMGAGLAKVFKSKYPSNFEKYKSACDANTLKVGTCLTTYENGKYIINFPTKIHYSEESEYSYISDGLDALIRHCNHYQIKSVAIPAIGCGLGGLSFGKVLRMIECKLQFLDLNIEVFKPSRK